VYLIYLVVKYRRVVGEKFNLASPSLLILLIGAFQLFFLFTTRYKFNRYYLVIIPFCIFLILEITKHAKIKKAVFVSLLAAFIVFSAAVAQDMMSWNQCKWHLGQQLLNVGISPRKMSAGFAWDAWHGARYASDHPFEIVSQRGDVPWWIEEMLPAVDPQYLISNSPVPTGFESLSYFDNDRYYVIDSSEYFSFFYARNMKVYLLEREQRADEPAAGVLFFDLLQNLKGAQQRYSGMSGEISKVPIDIDGDKKSAWVQSATSTVSFRIQLPHGRCRLRAALGVAPDSWDKPGDGVLCKILIDDLLLENLFHKIGAVRVSQIRQFFRPRTFFFTNPRTYFIRFINPSHDDPEAGTWQDICLDLSAFAGKAVNITFEVSAGPRHDEQNDRVLWAEPVIESY
jgi:hypothetical protein